MPKNNRFYAVLLLVAVALIVLSLSVLDGTAAYIGILIGLYFFLGVTFKLCRINEKVKGVAEGVIEAVFFWLF